VQFATDALRTKAIQVIAGNQMTAVAETPLSARSPTTTSSGRLSPTTADAVGTAASGPRSAAVRRPSGGLRSKED